MRAQILTAWGGPESFKLTDIPKPDIRPGMVLVRLFATSPPRREPFHLGDRTGGPSVDRIREGPGQGSHRYCGGTLMPPLTGQDYPLSSLSGTAAEAIDPD
jgi:hypothetical protein